MSERILVIDDEPDLLELVRVNLERSGYQIDLAENGRVAMQTLRHTRPDLILLDLMLPDVSGTELCRKLRADPDFADVPIIMLTAKADEVDRVVGFELGADDYVTKPFSPRELALRVAAVMRRKGSAERKDPHLEHGPLRLDAERHRCFVEGEEIELTAKEFELLRCLMTRSGHVMTRDALLERVWGADISVTSRTIDTHLKRLREKLRSAADLIETVRGVGYRFAE